MRFAAAQSYAFMGVIADHLKRFMPRRRWVLQDGQDMDSYLLDHLRQDRATVAYAYAARCLDLLRSITVLSDCALVDGTEIMARACIEHEAAALIAACGTDEVFEEMLRSSFRWQSYHVRLSGAAGTLPSAPAGWADGSMGWLPKRLFTEAAAIAARGDYSIERVNQMRWFHGYLSYREGHADLRIAVARQLRTDGLAADRGVGVAWVMNAAVEATGAAATCGAFVVGASMDAIHDATERFQDAVPIPRVPV